MNIRSALKQKYLPVQVKAFELVHMKDGKVSQEVIEGTKNLILGRNNRDFFEKEVKKAATLYEQNPKKFNNKFDSLIMKLVKSF